MSYSNRTENLSQHPVGDLWPAVSAGSGDPRTAHANPRATHASPRTTHATGSKAGRRTTRGLSLLEVLAVVTLMGILALIVIPRFSDHAGQAKGNACAVNKGNIEVQAQLWFRNTGNWPAADLSDIRTNRAYFPAGLPSCPMDGSAYGFDRTTQRVPGHQH